MLCKNWRDNFYRYPKHQATTILQNNRNTIWRGCRTICLATVLMLLSGIASILSAQQQAIHRCYYHRLPYGSDACFNPLSTIINGGFGILQINNRSTDLSVIDYATGWDNIIDNIFHPVVNIQRYSTRRFITTEIIPTSFRKQNGQWFPNYQLHTIGGGMTYVAMLEWFRLHHAPWPRAHAVVAWSVYHMLNEVVENSSYRGVNTDAIADLLIFNPLGLLMFQFNEVNRFFGETLHLRDWSFQPMYSPSTGTIENNGQNFCISFPVSRSTHWHAFYFFGVHGSAGPMYRTDSGRGFSAGIGLKAKDLIEIDSENDIRSLTTSLRWTAGVFYDRDYSLLASFIYSETKSYRFRVNIYPGIIRIGPVSPGVFCAMNADRSVVFGIHVPVFPFGWAMR